MNDNYWNEFYTNQEAPREPSTFARYVASLFKTKKSIIDLGCGNGRDTDYFNSLGHNASGIDKAIDGGDFIHIDIEADVYYSRFSIHSIDEDSLNKFFDNLCDVMKDDSLLFIETRSSKGTEFEGCDNRVSEFTSSIGGSHKRLLYSPKYLKDKLEIHGFSVLYLIEDKGLSYLGHDDPYVIRIIAKRNPMNSFIRSIVTEEHIEKQRKMLDLFENVYKILEENKIDAWLGYGSLVGCLRHGGFVPWDDDMDLCMSKMNLHKLIQIDWKDLTLIQGNETLFRIGNGEAVIDLFVLPFNNNEEKEMYINEIFPLKDAEFNGIKCKIPNNEYSFLNRRYGNSDIYECRIWNHNINDYWKEGFKPDKHVIRYEHLQTKYKRYKV